MIKGLNKFDQVENLSYFDLCNAKRSLQEKIKKRKLKEKTLEIKYDEIQKKYSPPKNSLEELEIATTHHELANIRIELSILESDLQKVDSRLQTLREKHTPQPGE